ncbi:CHRD domain-containing protein [Opitutus terrae]|uniref:CHRD domain containing protein n=1 Tax=Opitutus terrae (strain DSM 11246 / JCM 15787 / PB90-1) TaxID=452637 RepID=B1ZYZ4_OPITP|nr:CHRD domain-containing protein [Opitutus terrae]ACB76317.1 CHRD domain containing protein [Opitutus terrae PB90-1]
MKKLALLLLALALPHFVWAQLEFRTTLTGSQEVPPNDSPAWGNGFATLNLDTRQFDFNYMFGDLLAPQTAAHIHVAPPGVAGPVVHPLPLGSPSGLSLVLSETDVANLLAGNWYVNVHSELYRAGEIRGQFVPVPEPSTYALGGAALLGLAVIVRRRLQRRSPAAPLAAA